MSKPALWVRVLTWVFSSIFCLTYALTVMLQWVLWLILTMQFFGGWGGILGGLIAAVQIWLLFGTANKPQSCGIPSQVG